MFPVSQPIELPKAISAIKAHVTHRAISPRVLVIHVIDASMCRVHVSLCREA